MSADASARRILPQSSQMQSFSFAPTHFPPRENQKNYVFVDEHNRHKRLKVMRACEGCRRRKIKCDAATTNTWPCSSCVRLKLRCVPPTVQYDGGMGQAFEVERVDYESGSGDDDYPAHASLQQDLSEPLKPPQPLYPEQAPYPDSLPMYHHIQYSQPPPVQQTMQYSNIDSAGSLMDGQYSSQNIYSAPPLLQHSESPEGYRHDQLGTQDLVDLLGDLKVDASGVAPYLNIKKKKDLPEEPAFEDEDEYKHALPPLTGPDLKIRIPPELMPDDQTAMDYFDLYFDNVHPYVPVLNKPQFYQQWHNNRESISPLILEAIFAIAGQLADEPSQGQQWLAVLGRHAESFMDVPRLSTIQAMLMMLKARESAPKKGYFFLSWMTVVQCIAMAKDLGLDEHFDEHTAGKSCGSSHADCLTKTRIWQAVFVIELMIGTSQGRSELAIGVETVDFSIPRVGRGDSEFHVTRGFTYFARSIRNVAELNRTYSKIKGKKNWGLEPELIKLNPVFAAWLNELPPDQQIDFPLDGSLPWLSSHFVGNMHSYYYLSIIILHRAQLTFMDPSDTAGGWKQHMIICYSAAKKLCKLQEALLQQFGMTGLMCMQRGISFALYCVLTCTVLHLVALTSPDPDLNSESRDYLTRQMRILEKCPDAWPMPEMQVKIDALREAFSADTRKPFVLKQSVPFGSPIVPNRESPPHVIQFHHQPQLSRPPSMEQQSLEQYHLRQNQVSYTSNPMTPPVSACGPDSKSDSPAVQSLLMMATGQRIPQQQQPPPVSNTVPIVDPSTWNPSRIFDQWNTSFGMPASSSNAGTLLSPLRIRSPTGSGDISDLQNFTNGGLLPPPASQAIPPLQYSSAPIPTFVSPSMWQDSVASVYQGGLKRHWDYDGTSMSNHLMRRPR